MTTFPEPCRLIHDVDKTAWPDGPWKSEPDKVQWVDPATGLDCLIVRQPTSGHLCGYVGVPEGHLFFNVPYDDVDLEEHPHGGLTFSDKCDEGGRICHVPFEGRTDRVWWLGFDCAHYCDISPARARHYGEDERYRDVGYVKTECESLARSLAAKPRTVGDDAGDRHENEHRKANEKFKADIARI